ncbi:MAG: PilN domain-containing protein [candidate division Zixibacteria bacterium]|nr:PilN domain-containing protein [candidate division Zixibacteria bacterium]
MIEINLLPKDYLKKSFNLSLGKTGLYALGGAVGVIIMLAGITFYQTHQLTQLEKNIERARQRAAMLQRDILVVDALIDVKGKINNRMTAVERLDRHRSAWVRVLEDVAGNVPEFIWLGRLVEETAAAEKQTGAGAKKQAETPPAALPTDARKVSLEGYAFTLNALAKLMINMMRSDYFDEVELVSTEEKKLEEQKAYNFVLTANLHFLSDEELRNLIAQSGEKKESAKASHKVLN